MCECCFSLSSPTCYDSNTTMFGTMHDTMIAMAAAIVAAVHCCCGNQYCRYPVSNTPGNLLFSSAPPLRGQQEQKAGRTEPVF